MKKSDIKLLSGSFFVLGMSLLFVLSATADKSYRWAQYGIVISFAIAGTFWIIADYKKD